MVNAQQPWADAGLNPGLDPAPDPERALALSYAPAAARPALWALWALDDRLRRITLAVREPAIGLMRLTWWAEALAALDTAPPPGEPVLAAVAGAVLPLGVTGETLAAMIDGWERLIESEPDLHAFAAERGGRLFMAAAAALGTADPRVGPVGEGWALADLARGWPALGDAAAVLARDRLADAFDVRWPRPLRPLGALGLLARYDLQGTSRPGSPRRVARLLAHRLTGR